MNDLIENASTMDYSDEQIEIAKSLLTYGYYEQEYFEFNLDNVATSNLKDLTDLDDYSYILNDQDADVQCEDSGHISIVGKYKVITISDITDIYKQYTVTGDNLELNYSIASYGKIALSGSDDSLINLIKSIVYYYNMFCKKS